MTWFAVVLGGMLLAGGSASPDTLNARLTHANQAYEQGQYTRAEDRYRALLDSGYTSGALYHNLGNTYVRLDRLGQAIQYYEKARRLRPDDAHLLHNLEQARRQAGVYPERLDEAPPRSLSRVVQDWSPLALFLGGGLLFCVGLLVAVLRTHPGGEGVLRRPLVWGPLVGGLLLVGVAMGTSYLQSTHVRAVVVVEDVSLRAAPSADASPDSTLLEGRMVEVQHRRAQWREVRLADGTTGWLPARALGAI